MGFVVGPVIGLIFGLWLVGMSLASNAIFGTPALVDPAAGGVVGLCTLLGFFPLGFAISLALD